MLNSKNKLLLFLLLFNLIHRNTLAVNHWIVTQTGKIQAYLETPFDLRRPHDLLALLDQEQRRNEINQLYDDLINRQAAIESKWAAIDKNSNIGLKIASQDSDCKATGTVLDLYGNMASNGTERKTFTLRIPKKFASEETFLTPVCSEFGTLNDLESTDASYKTMNLHSDESLLKNFVPVSLDVFGHYIAMALSKNNTSWVHYNLGSIYWRIKRDGDRAVECVKLAIQHVTVEYRDIPLLNFAGILHQARYSKEAVRLLETSITLAPHQPIHYLAMSNIYAAMGDYNTSITYYDQYLKLNPSDVEVAASRHAILCYSKLENGLTSLQNDLQMILTELHDYHSLQQQWLRLLERLMWEHASFDYQFDGVHPAMLAGESGRKIQRCVQKTSENTNKPVISCDFYDKGPDLDKLNLQHLFQFVENEKQKLNEQIGKTNIGDEHSDKSGATPILYPKFPTSMSTKGDLYFDVTGWPKKDECLLWDLPVTERDNLDLPLFLPPENKGYQVRKILTDYIGLSEGAQHDLPWYPPLCEHADVNGEKYFSNTDRSVLDNELKTNGYLKNILLKYVNDGKADEAEIGQRIIAAMEKKVAPKWVLATIASLYWRVRGNARKAMDCLDMAFQTVPKDSTDIVLVSLGSVMYQMGFADQAMKFATLAFKINYVEPSTNFLLSLLHYKNTNPLLAMYYMKNVLRVEPDFYDGEADKLLKTWACRIKLGATYSRVHDNIENSDNQQAICTRSEPTMKGEGMVCTRDGENCKTATIQCYKKVDAVDLISKMNEKDLEAQGNCLQSKEKLNLGQTIISSLLAAETASNDLEPDQSRLETLVSDVQSNVHHHVHMRLSLGEEHPFREHAAIGDFFVALTDEPDDENKLHIYDKYGTYTLSASGCKNVPVLQKFKYATIWPSIVSRSPDISTLIKPLPKDTKGKDLKPYCSKTVNSQTMLYDLDKFTRAILDRRLPSSPEKHLSELLGLMASNQKLPLKELGARMAVALKSDPSSWILLTASSVYWRIIGNSEQAVLCLRAALSQVPPDMLDVPLMHLANLLNRMGFHKDALEMGSLALRSCPNYVLNHFTLANIHITMGEYERAVAFFRACLALDQNFEPARERLRAVLCSLLFDDTSNNAQHTANIARRVIQVVD